jgi:hypothetical protein
MALLRQGLGEFHVAGSSSVLGADEYLVEKQNMHGVHLHHLAESFRQFWKVLWQSNRPEYG